MTAKNQVGKTLGEQMADLLLRKPKNFDVTFNVGPEKVKVEAVKFILKAASPVFEREFEENWENGVATDDNGIPLPNFDPTTFQQFVNLLILDAWSLASIKSLKLSPNNLLRLLGLCRQYEITKAIGNLEEAADDFIQTFDNYKDTDEFLETSRENLEIFFSFERIPLDETKIFKCACRWASNRCTIEGLEPTGKNYREVLGASLFEIRFPTMSNEEFTKVGYLKKNVLKAEEKLAVYEYIGLDIDKKKKFDKSQLPFKTKRREVNTSFSSGCSVLSLPLQFKTTSSPPHAGESYHSTIHIQVNKKISLHGFGFLGPIDEDAYFDVSVQIRRVIFDSCEFDSGTFKKTIFAPKGKIFHFLLEPFIRPIVVHPSRYGYDNDWLSFYAIHFSLKGHKNMTLQNRVEKPKEESLEASGVRFYLESDWYNDNPLAELLFKKM